MFFPRKLVFLLITFHFTSLSLVSQEQKCIADSNFNGAIECLSNYIQLNQSFLEKDSSFTIPLNFILNYYIDSTLSNKIIETRKIIQTYDPLKILSTVDEFTDTLTSRRKYFNEKRELLTRKDSLISSFDSIGIEENDSSFIELLDLMYEDSIIAESETDTLNSDHFYPDSLINAIQTVLKYAKQDSNLNWINELRNDTTYIFITDVEGDSIPLKLFSDNNRIVKFDITDFWGITYPGVIRDIKPNSFRLLINDAPELTNDAENKARKAVSSLITIDQLGYDIILKKRPFPKNIKPWMFYGNSNFDASQIVLHQWAKGGESSISFLSGVELYLKYKKEKHNWDSYGKFKLGLIRQGDYSNDSTAFFKTNEDRIDIQTQYGYKIFKNYSMSVLGNFKSQFAPSKDYSDIDNPIIISKFMNPAHITFAVGLNYKNGKKASVFFSPITAKTTLVLNDSINETKFGIEEGEKARHELGAIFKANHKTKIWGDIAMENTLELFSNYMESPQNIDFEWDFKLLLPVNDYIRATISTQIVYDDDETITKRNEDGTTYQSKGVQIKEMLSIGFLVKF